MRVALVHDWLNTKFGGAEQVLLELAAMYPNAPIYTLIYNQEVAGAIDPGRVRTSYLQRLPRWLQTRSRYLLPLIPTAVEQFDFSGYDVVISSSSAFVKGIITRPETIHICYCHTPMRFVWDYWPRYIDEQHVGPVRRAMIHRLTSRLRLWDFYSAERVDHWIANSTTTAQRIEKYYRQTPDTIIYPGADLRKFHPSRNKKPYFATFCTLTPYKKVDLAIQACNRLQLPLVVIGDGADRQRLEAMAGPTIRFAGRVTDSERATLLAEAQALINPNEEDFGIIPVEVMASGTPVIAYGKGGLTETVVEGSTGLFFHQQTVDAICDALERFKNVSFKTETLTKRAHDFSTERFRKDIAGFVEKTYKEYHNGRD